MNVIPFPKTRQIAEKPLPRPIPPDPAGLNITSFWGTCPWSEELSEYDAHHVALYARLLQDEADGASHDDLARNVFGLDPILGQSRAGNIVRSHLKRARWVAETLIPLLIGR